MKRKMYEQGLIPLFVILTVWWCAKIEKYSNIGLKNYLKEKNYLCSLKLSKECLLDWPVVCKLLNNNSCKFVLLASAAAHFVSRDCISR